VILAGMAANLCIESHLRELLESKGIHDLPITPDKLL